MIVSKTPLRVSLFGGGTDFPEYFRSHSGAVIGGCIDKFVYCSLIKTTDGIFEHKVRLAYRQSEYVNNLNELKHRAAAAVLASASITSNVEVSITADLPARVGLGSSSSFTVGLLNASLRFKGNTASPRQLADRAIAIERTELMEHGGWQDQIFAAFGGFNLIRFKEDQYNVEKVNVSKDCLLELESNLILYFTGIYRDAKAIESDKLKRISETSTQLSKINDHALYAADVITKGTDLGQLGALFHQTWIEKKKLSPLVSNSSIDRIYSTALANGATGGKILGAGAGGFLLLFCPPERSADVRRALSSLVEVKFRFWREGSSVCFI